MGVTLNSDAPLTIEEKKALTIIEETTLFQGNRFEVGLLWRYENIRLPDSYPMALSRLRCLENQFKSSPSMLDSVANQLHQYLLKGYIRELSPQELSKEYQYVWYLPFFPVKNPNKPNKFRLVWDAAAKVDGISLNEMLLKGPDLTASLLGILFRFREKKVALTADIQEMFHRVQIRGNDQHAQRFLWRGGDSTTKPRIFVMTAMTFGATCSPFQAQYTKNVNAARYKEKFPRAVRAITQNHYVDDCLDCVDTVEEAVRLAKEIKFIHAAGGFHIRNFRSNSKEVEHAMNEDQSDVPYQFASPDDNLEKVLGIFWDTKADVITYSLRHNKSNQDILFGNRIPTKRETLRTLMSIYDPPGYLAHYLINLKILQQDLWRCKLGWDDPITEDAFKKWLTWKGQLRALENIRIPRSYLTRSSNWNNCISNLHIFVDASAKACAAVGYLQIKYPSCVEVVLVGAKTKVAPLKILSIPRLELIAAILGIRLAKTIKENHSIKISSIQYWSDSKVVLAWIQSNKKLTQYVSLRVSEIHENSNANDWRYIPTNKNIADLATKWRDKTDLSLDSNWFAGPPFLKENDENWPSSLDLTLEQCLEEDIQDIFVAHHAEVDSVIQFNRFSNWNRLLRTTAYVKRYLNIKTASSRTCNEVKGSLSADELKRAEEILVYETQKQVFRAEIAQLKQNKQLSKQSSLYKLSPFIDERGILRIQGRVEEAKDCEFDAKYPNILPPCHHVTMLIVSHEHRRCLHNFNETVVTLIRQRFYIPRLRRLVSKVRQNCSLCRIRSAKPQVPPMAPLPSARLASYSPPRSPLLVLISLDH